MSHSRDVVEPPKIFFSWQSDLPNSTNRGFIERALELAIKEIAADASIEIAPRLDDAAADVVGAEDLAATIQRKIDEAAVFVGDVSIIGYPKPNRPTPNPNVLVETGYAIKALGPGRTIMVFNDRFGRLEELPFDLRPRLAMRYTATEVESGVVDETRAQSRRKLASALASAIKDILVRHSAETAARAAEVLREAEETRVERERRDLELARLRSENEIRLIVTQQGPAARSPAWLMTTINIENYGEAQFVVEEHYCDARPNASYWNYVKMRATNAALRFPTVLKTNAVVRPGDTGQLAFKVTLESVRDEMTRAGLPNPSEWNWTYLDMLIVVRCQARGRSVVERQLMK